MNMDYKAVIEFWFETIKPAQWWKKDAEFDRVITEQFGHWHTAAGLAELVHWRQHPEGRLAEIIVLDQFSRNIYRDQPKSFAFDGMALVLSQQAIDNDDDKKLDQQKRLFMYMPYMHSESKVIHQQAVVLFQRLGLEGNLEFELKHKAIIDRFGRYPHRNTILGRQSTEQEIEFLQQPDSSF
jgi:uncharacterized protein (DUF924 family)